MPKITNLNVTNLNVTNVTGPGVIGGPTGPTGPAGSTGATGPAGGGIASRLGNNQGATISVLDWSILAS